MSLRNVLLLPAMLFLMALQPIGAQSVVFQRAATLKRGINLSGWFASSRDLSPQHLGNFIKATDLNAIHTMGFDFVRLGIEPSLFESHGQIVPPDPQALAELDLAVQEALDNHLEVVLCVFPDDQYKQNLDSERGVDDFVQLWRNLATHFVSEDHARIFYELLNEPELPDPYRWMGIQARVDDAIRRIDPYHTIVATAAGYSNPPDLLRLEPVDDSNVIYNFHFYSPHTFTHQGASWGADNWIFYKDIPYPATASDLARQLKNVPGDVARFDLYEYGMDNWNAQGIAGRIAFMADWAHEHHVPLICDEFGAYRKTAPPASRRRWIHDVRAALEANHIGWAMWDYSGNFGIVTRTATQIIPDDATLKALGLNAAAKPVLLSGQ